MTEKEALKAIIRAYEENTTAQGKAYNMMAIAKAALERDAKHEENDTRRTRSTNRETTTA